MTLEANVKPNASGWHSREFRASSLARHAESGLSAVVFSRQEGIKPKTFRRWRREARCPRDPGLVLVPVRVRARVAARTDLLVATLGAMEALS